MRCKFGDLVEGQIFTWNSQTFIKMHLKNGQNAAQLYIDDGPFGLFQGDVFVEYNDDQFSQSVQKYKEQLEELREDADFLYCLQNAGVVNWEGYEKAIILSNQGS